MPEGDMTSLAAHYMARTAQLRGWTEAHQAGFDHFREMLREALDQAYIDHDAEAALRQVGDLVGAWEPPTEDD